MRNEIDYKKWASMSSLTIEQIAFLTLGLNPDKSFASFKNNEFNQIIANNPDIKNEEQKRMMKTYLTDRFGGEYEKMYEEAINMIVTILEGGGYILDKSNTNWRKIRIPKKEIEDSFLALYGDYPEKLKFLFEYKQKELLEQVKEGAHDGAMEGVATIQNADFGIAQNKAIEILGTVVYILANEREKLQAKLTATGIWKYITQNHKYANIARINPDRAKRLISKYLKLK